MANSLNKVILMGNLTRDPELRQVGENNSVCNLGLAMNRRFTTSSGEDREETCFVDVETWGRVAENCNRYLSKGRPVLVEGRLRQDRWEDKETGAARSRLLVRAENVQFLTLGQSERSQNDEGGSRRDGPSVNESASRAVGPDDWGGDDSGASSKEDDIPF